MRHRSIVSKTIPAALKSSSREPKALFPSFWQTDSKPRHTYTMIAVADKAIRLGEHILVFDELPGDK